MEGKGLVGRTGGARFDKPCFMTLPTPVLGNVSDLKLWMEQGIPIVRPACGLKQSEKTSAQAGSLRTTGRNSQDQPSVGWRTTLNHETSPVHFESSFAKPHRAGRESS